MAGPAAAGAGCACQPARVHAGVRADPVLIRDRAVQLAVERSMSKRVRSPTTTRHRRPDGGLASEPNTAQAHGAPAEPRAMRRTAQTLRARSAGRTVDALSPDALAVPEPALTSAEHRATVHGLAVPPETADGPDGAGVTARSGGGGSTAVLTARVRLRNGASPCRAEARPRSGAACTHCHPPTALRCAGDDLRARARPVDVPRTPSVAGDPVGVRVNFGTAGWRSR